MATLSDLVGYLETNQLPLVRLAVVDGAHAHTDHLLCDAPTLNELIPQMDPNAVSVSLHGEQLPLESEEVLSYIDHLIEDEDTADRLDLRLEADDPSKVPVLAPTPGMAAR